MRGFRRHCAPSTPAVFPSAEGGPEMFGACTPRTRTGVAEAQPGAFLAGNTQRTPQVIDTMLLEPRHATANENGEWPSFKSSPTLGRLAPRCSPRWRRPQDASAHSWAGAATRGPSPASRRKCLPGATFLPMNTETVHSVEAARPACRAVGRICTCRVTLRVAQDHIRREAGDVRRGAAEVRGSCRPDKTSSKPCSSPTPRRSSGRRSMCERSPTPRSSRGRVRLGRSPHVEQQHGRRVHIARPGAHGLDGSVARGGTKGGTKAPKGGKSGKGSKNEKGRAARGSRRESRKDRRRCATST